jgi:tripartite-type tricarboxylate transporter receptor subunit TctC
LRVRKKFIVAGFLMVAAAAHAQNFPAKPVRVITPFTAGSAIDTLARVLGQKLGDTWGQQVVIDNRIGANGIIGTEAAAKAAPDGYTVYLGNISTLAVNPHLYLKLPYEALRDFAPVTLAATIPVVLVVHPSLPVKSVKELIALARSRPGALDYGSGGVGNATHIASERFASMAGVKLNHVPYRGVGPAIAALLQGEVQILFASSVAVQPYIKSGRMRVLAVTGDKRIAQMSDVPTVSEAGVPGFIEGNWQAVLVPAKTPRPIINRLNQELVRIIRTPEIAAQIRQVGAEVIANSPDETGALIRTDLKKYAEVIKKLDIKME